MPQPDRFSEISGLRVVSKIDISDGPPISVELTLEFLEVRYPSGQQSEEIVSLDPVPVTMAFCRNEKNSIRNLADDRA